MDSALERLVTACEEAYMDPRDPDHFTDEEDVSIPPTGITFGMIREARKALVEQD